MNNNHLLAQQLMDTPGNNHEALVAIIDDVTPGFWAIAGQSVDHRTEVARADVHSSSSQHLPFSGQEAYILAAAWALIEEIQYETVAEVLQSAKFYTKYDASLQTAIVNSNIAQFVAHIFNERQRESIVNLACRTVPNHMSRVEFEAALKRFEERLYRGTFDHQASLPSQIRLYLIAKIFDKSG